MPVPETTQGSITANCGHEVECFEHLIFVYWPDEDCDAVEGFYPCVTQSPQCPDCAGKIWLAPDWPTFATEQEAEDWLLKAARERRAKKGVVYG